MSTRIWTPSGIEPLRPSEREAVRQTLHRKQRRTFRQSQGFFNLAHGSVRSGKTFVLEMRRWVDHVRRTPQGDLLMAGRTLKALERNVLRPLQDWLGPQRFSYSLGNKTATLLGRRIELEGANDVQAEAKIRGMTLAGALLNEVTLYPEGFVREVINRSSAHGAAIFATTNPDSPFHYLKADFIDREAELAAQGFDLRVWHYTLDDNPALSASYVAAVKASHSGLWYKRFVLGLWVQAAGAVYEQWDEDHHVRSVPPFPHAPSGTAIGVDYGTANATAFVHLDGWAVTSTGLPRFHVPRAESYDGREKGQRTDAQHADALAAFLDPLPGRPPVYVDPSAASFAAVLKQRGVNVRAADNSVLDGIRFVSAALGNPDDRANPSPVRLTVDPSCEALRREFSAYVWDERAQKRGEDKPAKEHDHALDALRYAAFTHWGQPRLSASDLPTVRRR